MSATEHSDDPSVADRLPRLSCESREEGPGVVRVKLNGELDLATAPEVADALAEASRGAALVILDLSEITFMDSRGLQVICTAKDRLSEVDGRLVIIPGGRQVQRLFELTNIDRRLEFVSAKDADRLVPTRSD
jgi:anti-anti-sigma factor